MAYDDSAYTYSASRDYRRRTATESEAGRFWGGAGAPHAYVYEHFNPVTKVWQLANPGEHFEAENYFWAGVNSPSHATLLSQSAVGQLAGEQLALFEHPEIMGQAGQRGWNVSEFIPASYMAQNLLGTYGITLSQQQYAAGKAFLDRIAQEASRQKKSGFGSLLSMAGVAAAIYTGGAAAGLWGGAEAAAGTVVAAGAEAAASTAASATLAESLAAGAASGFASGAASTFGGAALGTAAGISAGTIAGSSLGLAATLETLKQAKEVVSTVQLVNKVTGQKTVVPKNSPIPAGYAIDPTWNSSIGDPAGSSLTQAIAALKGQNMNLNTANPAAVVQPGTGAVNPLVGIAMVAAVLYFVSR